MFKKFFETYPRYTLLQKPDEAVLNAFKDKLPDQLTGFWQAHGFGIFMDGYLKLVNPLEYQADLDNAYHNTDDEIVFAITGMGDFLTWTGDAIRAVYFNNGNESIIESGDDMEWFFDMDLADEGFVRSNLSYARYRAARKLLGDLNADECYGYVPLLSLGGAEKVQNLRKVNIREHLAIIAQTNGKIK